MLGHFKSNEDSERSDSDVWPTVGCTRVGSFQRTLNQPVGDGVGTSKNESVSVRLGQHRRRWGQFQWDWASFSKIGSVSVRLGQFQWDWASGASNVGGTSPVTSNATTSVLKSCQISTFYPPLDAPGSVRSKHSLNQHPYDTLESVWQNLKRGELTWFNHVSSPLFFWAHL